MARKPRHKKPPCKIKPYVAENIDRLINKFYGDLNDTNQAKRLHEVTGLGKNTIIRARDAYDQSAPGIDTIEILAEHFGFEPYQLLLRNLDISSARVRQKKGKAA